MSSTSKGANADEEWESARDGVIEEDSFKDVEDDDEPSIVGNILDEIVLRTSSLIKETSRPTPAERIHSRNLADENKSWQENEEDDDDVDDDIIVDALSFNEADWTEKKEGFKPKTWSKSMWAKREVALSLNVLESKEEEEEEEEASDINNLFWVVIKYIKSEGDSNSTDV